MNKLRRHTAALAAALLAAVSAFASIVAQSAGPRSLWAVVLIAAAAVFTLLTFRTNIPGRDRPVNSDRPLSTTVTPEVPVRPSQLARDLFDFVGRDRTLADLHDELTAVDTVLPTVVVTGMGGTGKTVFAARLCHALSPQFPDGQLYINMQGYGGPEGPGSVDPADALTEFLLALGVAGQAVPPGLQDKARMYRSCLAGRHTLIMVDNVSHEAQVRPLLPGSPTSLVVVTSRAALAGLDGVRPVHLGVFTEDEALTLLSRLVGKDRMHAEPEAARVLVGLCGLLPLAVRIAGARLAAHRRWRLERLVALLTDERRRLDELRAGDVDVQASLALTYHALAAPDQRAFRLLSQLNILDFAAWVVAAATDAPPAEADATIERLLGAHIVEEVAEDAAGQPRYRLHDLVRAYGRQRLHVEEAPGDAAAALRRTVGAYLTLAEAADRQIQPGDMHGAGERRAERWRVAEHDERRVAGDPMRWLAAERTCLLQIIEQARAAGLQQHVWELPNALADFFDVTARWDDWARTHQLALTAARDLASRRGEAITLYHLGRLHRYRQDYPEAIRCLRQAREIYKGLGDRLREACALRNLGFTLEEAGRLAEALQHYQECLPTFRALGHEVGQALTLRGVGIVYADAGRYEEAEDVVGRAVAILRRNGHAFGEANALEDLGSVQLRSGRLAEAIEALRQSLAIFESFGHVVGEANVLTTLGDLYARQDRVDDASACLRQALERYQRLQLSGPAQVVDLRLTAISQPE